MQGDDTRQLPRGTRNRDANATRKGYAIRKSETSKRETSKTF